MSFFDDDDDDRDSMPKRIKGTTILKERWDAKLHDELEDFSRRLRREHSMLALRSSTDMPWNVVHQISRISAPVGQHHSDIATNIRNINKHDAFIKNTLRDKLQQKGIQYNDVDDYENVANYAKAYRIKTMRELLPWLGRTDYNVGSNGHAGQVIKLSKEMKKQRDSTDSTAGKGGKPRAKTSKLRKRKQKSRKMRKCTLRK